MRCALQTPRGARPACRQVAGWRLAPAHGRSLRLQVRAGLFDFLNPGGGSKGPSSSQRAAEVAGELLEFVGPTAAGTRASAERREQIEELAQELKQFSVKNASRSKLLFGEYEVLYISAPGAPGSPLAGPSGVLALSGQLPSESIDQDGTYSSQVEFKQLFFNGSFKRNGFIRPLGPDSYQLEVNETVYQAGLGGATTKDVEESYKVQILYLSEELRIVQVSEEEGDEGVLMVLKRADIEEEEEEEQAQAGAPIPGLFGAKSSQPGLATMSERQVRRQMAEEEARRAAKSGGTSKIAASGTGKVLAGTGKVAAGTGKVAASGSAKIGLGAIGLGAAAKAAGPSGSAKVGLGVAGRAAPAPEGGSGKVAVKAAAAPRAAPVDDGKAAREKKAEAEKQSAIKELLNSLTEALKGSQAETKQALADVKEAERAGAAAVKKAAAAKATVEKAEAATEETEEALAEALGDRKEAESKLQQAQAALAQANNRLGALLKQKA